MSMSVGLNSLFGESLAGSEGGVGCDGPACSLLSIEPDRLPALGAPTTTSSLSSFGASSPPSVSGPGIGVSPFLRQL